MKISQALSWAIKKLNKAKIRSANLDADFLLCNVLKKDKAFLYSHPDFELNKKQISKYKKYISRRAKHEPVAYIVGQKEFYGLNFKVNKDVLIPRPETEILVDEVLQLTTGNKQLTTILEIGTGSGCVSIALAKNIENIKIIATDVCKKALQIAKENVKLHRVEKKIKFVKSNLLNDKMLKCFNANVLIANLPYLPEKYKKEVERDLFYEPQKALWARKNGLDLIKKLLKQIEQLGNKPKYILLEIDPSQKSEIEKLKIKGKIKFIKDLSERDRVLKIEIKK